MAKTIAVQINGIKAAVSTGNIKMSQTLIFNLPTKTTCPGSTEMCRNKCYACKAERGYRNVLSSRMGNLEASKGSEFVDKITGVIKKYFKDGNGFFRIHESGDFYSQEYINAWFEIARQNPTIKFLTFTKSYMFDFSNCPSNLKLIYSVWEDTKHIMEGMTYSFAGNVSKRGKCLECPGHCDDCRVCWYLKSDVNVHFDIH